MKLTNGKLQQEVKEILEGGEIPQRVANRLIMAGVVENYRLSEKNTKALFGDGDQPGLIAEVSFWKRINWLLLTLLMAEAIAIVVR
jgi:hypothetical protein